MARLAIGPTRALRETLELLGAVEHGRLVDLLAQRGVGGARAERAIRRAIRHEQLELDDQRRYILSLGGPRKW